MHFKAGETYFRQGDPADAMFVILEGQLQTRGELGGETIVISIEARGRDRHAALFQNEAIYGERAGGHRCARVAISLLAVSRT